MENQKPKLNNISYNKDTRIRLLKSKPYIGKNGQGEYRMWTFTDLEDNETKVFFAPEDAHAVLQNLGEGSELILRKVPLQDGSKISPKFELTVVNAVARNGNGKTHVDHGGIMRECLKSAVEITKEVDGVPWRSEDIQRISVAMYISRTH